MMYLVLGVLGVIAVELAAIVVALRRARQEPGPTVRELAREAAWREAAIEGVRALVPRLRELEPRELEPAHVREAFEAARRERRTA